MTEMLDITPDTHFLDSIRADRGSYADLLAEGVDNSIDADASEMALTLTRDLVSLEDNGIGITKDRESAIVKLGEHRAMPTTMLGRFGIGLKYHAVSAGNFLEVDSISTDGRMKLMADWEKVTRGGKWQIPKPIWVPTLTSAKTGTHIYIRNLRWAQPTSKEIEIARDKLAQIFYPAVLARKIIILNGRPVPILQEPEMIHIVEGEVRLENGKGARVRAGITKQPGRLYHVQVSYKHRVIMPQSPFGCGEYTGLRRIFARVDLTGPWGLSRFKNALADNDAPELEDRVLEILKPILEELHSAQMSAIVDEMTDILNNMLPPELVSARPPKKKSLGDSTIKIRKTRKRIGITKEGNETPRGPARKQTANNRILIDFEEPVVDEFGYGYFLPGRPSRIILAKDNPHINTLLSMRDKMIGAQSLFAIALMIYMHARDMEPGEKELPGIAGPFGLRVWNMTRQQKIGEEQSA
jgi:Histidine kinase-, DNA gyrase B-, and HSP90-like ATPase